MSNLLNNIASKPPRISRRRILAGLASGFACLWLNVTPARAADNGEAVASQFIEQTGEQLVQVINSHDSDQQRTDQLQSIVDQAVNVPDVARFCLGRFAHTASPQQLADYTGLFRRSLTVNISSKLGEYRGLTFKITRTQSRGETELVDTLVTRPNNAPNVIQWVVSFQTGKPLIVDLIAEGTSLRLTQRSDYASFLAHNGNDVSRLIAALHHQVGR